MGNELVQAYRQLYKHILRAVQYSKPAKYIYRDRLREEFRKNDASCFDQSKIQNTIEFLKAAAHDRGVEHRVVKNLSHVWWHQGYRPRNGFRYRDWNDERIQRGIYDHFDHTIKMLNESLDMCIPLRHHWQWTNPKMFLAGKQASVGSAPYVLPKKYSTRHL